MTLESILNQISSFIWGPLTLIFLLGVGVYLMLGLKGFPLKDLGYGFKSLFKKSKKQCKLLIIFSLMNIQLNHIWVIV